ncbi:MAG: NADH-quinone oxidoreductase subunit J [Ignavibacteriae bacterium]|nr:MAG: NADH-quinone oxidoreductase subunit J [Ignavibacteriota bacterium]
MNYYEIIFYVFAVLTVVSAGVVVFSRNIIYSAFALLFTFTGVAGIYVLLNADFIAITQLLIYVGGIMILLIFGVMLTTNVTNVEITTQTLKALPATIVVAIVSALLVSTMVSTKWAVKDPISVESTTINQIGELLLTKYLLPFEIASIVLLIAMMGAAFLARKN